MSEQGRYAEAHQALVACSAEACPSVIRKACIGWLDDLMSREPTIVVAAHDASGRDLERVRVRVDGKVLTETLDGRPLLIDPGPHVLKFDAAGQSEVEQRLVVRAGEKNRKLVVAFGEPSSARARPTASSPRSKEETSPSVSTTPVWPIALGSVAAVSLGVSVYLVLSAVGDLHTLEASPCATTRTCPDADVRSARSRLTASEILFAVGAASGGAAILLLFTSRKPAGSVSLGVAPTRGGARAGLEGSF